MRKISVNQRILVVCLGIFFVFAAPLSSQTKRFQVEFYGGISSTGPDDLNLFSRAEEQYNDVFFVRYIGYQPGFFVNEFPKITSTVPLGTRVKYRLSPSVSVSVGVEWFSRRQRETMEGTFTNERWQLDYTKKYEPYEMKLSCFSILGGIHYVIPLGKYTGIEAGAAAGWSRANFNFRSQWSYDVVFNRPVEINTSYHDGGTLEGDGEGSGFLARASLRINRNIGRNLGFFIEGAYTYCRLKDFEGTGRETRDGIPGETTWSGQWGIKKEEIHTSWFDETVYVPTNYWENWNQGQRDRDFVLDLSGFHLSAGIYLKF